MNRKQFIRTLGLGALSLPLAAKAVENSQEQKLTRAICEEQGPGGLLSGRTDHAYYIEDKPPICLAPWCSPWLKPVDNVEGHVEFLNLHMQDFLKPDKVELVGVYEFFSLETWS